MLHTPTSETKTETAQGKAQPALLSKRENHSFLHGQGGPHRFSSSDNVIANQGPGAQRHQTVAGLQATYGNQAVLRTLHTSPQVARMTPLRPSQSIMLQRKCACGGSVEVEEECAECKAKREAALQRSVGNQATPSVATTVPPIVHDVLRSPGHPLDADARAFMEPRFGHDFSQVRVHSDAKAAESAWAVNALAYTIGRDVVFGAGRYAPGTSEGRKLLAHELTHVVQQCVQSRLQTNLEIGVVDDVFEREASEVATHVQDGKTSTPYVRFDRPALHREILQRAAIEDDARFLMVNCMELTCDDVYACPDNDNGITCPEGTLHASEKFRPLLYCDKDCKNKKTCDDNAEWIALPHSNFADGSYKQCDEDLVICANHKFTHAKVRERSNKEAWEASNAVAKALGENPDFKGSVYGDEKDREFKKDTRCHKKKPPREKKS